MRIIRNEKGIALVTSLMLTLISLAVVMALMYFVTAGIQVSAANKRYKNVVEAAYGGVSLAVNEFIPSLNNAIFGDYSSDLTALLGKYGSSNIDLALPSGNCLKTKLDNATVDWGACSRSLDPRDKPDMTFVLKSSLTNHTTDAGFRVFTKIVDTPVKGNTDKADNANLSKGENITESAEIEGTGVTIPTTYRVEVRAERETNPKEKANISVLYAY
jgi:hypothetical protein